MYSHCRKNSASLLAAWLLAIPVTATLSALAAAAAEEAPNSAAACPGDNGGLSLAPGFCATVFADNIGHARHLVVAPNGTVYVNTWSGRYYKNDRPPAGGFLVALKDSKGSGQADLIERFGKSPAEGSAGGSGIAVFDNAIYAEVDDRILKFPLPDTAVAPTAQAETILSGMPLTGDHPMHPFIIDADGNLFVDMGTASNACELQNRMPKSVGHQPCVEKQTRGGVWKYQARKPGQKFAAKDRYASGIRNGEPKQSSYSACKVR